MKTEIFEKVILKAKKGGYKPTGFDYGHLAALRDSEYGAVPESRGYYETIFNHDFARAFWGERLTEHCKYTDSEIHDDCVPLKFWEYHIRIMSLEEEKLLYLYQFLAKEVN